MKMSFCIICYNEEHLIRQQLINLYPFAHEIIVVEGRVLEFGDKFPKERDRTLEIIRDFPDHDNKIKLFTKETWPSKENMVALYYREATGDYVWHIDVDEFYTPECIENTFDYIEETEILNYAHVEYYYFRYYNVVVAKGGKLFWNRPARIHRNLPNRHLRHRPQLIIGSKPDQIKLIPPAVGIRHHYSIMTLDKVKVKANFYGMHLHGKYFHVYDKPLKELINKRICVRPDNDGKTDSVATVLDHHKVEIPPGIDLLYERYSPYFWLQGGDRE